jgi:hypothetical protein
MILSFLIAVIENTYTTPEGGTGLQQENSKSILLQKEKLAVKIENLADLCGLSNRKVMPKTLLIKAISTHSCERRILYEISNKAPSENRKFDTYYRQKSAFATIKILDRVKTALSATGLEATILTEVFADSARYDIVVRLSKLGEFHSWDSKTVRIEIKASLGLDFEQIGRYLWYRSPLILVRVMTGHVAKIYPSEIQSYVSFSLEELCSKIDRLLSKRNYAVPGVDCADCTNNKCAYWAERSERSNFVTLPDIEFGGDLKMFYRNLSYVAERTAIMVIEELKRFTMAKKQTDEVFPSMKQSQVQPQKT